MITIRTYWAGAGHSHITSPTSSTSSRRGAHNKIKGAVINHIPRWMIISFLQNAIPKLGFECFKDHPQRNISIKRGNPMNICKVEMLVDDVFSIFPLQTNGTLPARLTAGGIHGQNIFLTRAKFSSRRSVVRNGSGGVVCCVSNMAFQNGARIFSDEYLYAKFQFLSEVHYRKFFRSLLPKILPKFTTENSSEVYHRKFFRSLLPKILPKFTTENFSEVYCRKFSEVYNRKFLRSLLPKILPKFTAEKFKSTWRAAEKGTSDLTDTSFQPNVIFPIDLLRALLGKQIWHPKWR